MTPLTLEQFVGAMSLLSAVYGADYPPYKNQEVAQIWYEFFTKYSVGRFQAMIRHYVTISPWFPKAPNEILKAWEDSGQEQRPGENWQNQPLLNSAEANQLEEIENLSAEQRAENIKRLNALIKIGFAAKGDKVQLSKLATAPMEELEAIAVTCNRGKQYAISAQRGSSDDLANSSDDFADMRKYFHSGSERYRQIALDWAANPANNCEIIRSGNQIVDIKENPW